MKISKEHLSKIITEEVQRALSEISDDELDRLLDMGRQKKPKPEQQPEKRPLSYLGKTDVDEILALFSELDPKFQELTLDKLNKEFENDKDDDLFFERKE